MITPGVDALGNTIDPRKIQQYFEVIMTLILFIYFTVEFKVINLFQKISTLITN